MHSQTKRANIINMDHSISLILFVIFLATITQPISARAYNQAFQSDIPLTTSHEAHQDPNDRAQPYDSSSTDSREDDTSETSGLPAPNELSVIRLNDTSVVLRWEFPDNAQEHLQFFKIQHKLIKRDSQWRTELQEIAPTTRACQINQLRPGNVQFSVIAVYDNDDNISSEPFKYRIRARSKIRPEEMPEMKAPEIYWSEAKADYFRFKWRYEPKEKDHDIFGYLVYYRSAHTVSDFTIYNTMDSNVEIADVEPDTPYEAKVVAYNTVGVSEFSDTITIRTEAQPNTTASAAPTNSNSQSQQSSGTNTSAPVQILSSTSTTRRPLTVSWPQSDRAPATTPVDLRPTTTQTPRPVVVVGPPPSSNNATSSSLANIIYKTITNAFQEIIGDQSDAMLIIRYLLLVMLPILFIVSVLICLIRGPNLSQKRNEFPTSSATDDSMQFDLEINDYFKNSFPGVDTEYSSVANHNGVHNGFVNNHPHLSDFA